MFTGLIRETAHINLIGDRLEVRSNCAPKIGESIAVNGACLTVTDILAGAFALKISHETQSAIALENLRGSAHIEQAMQLGERIDGHITQGHIDAIGTIERITKRGENSDFIISAPRKTMRFIAAKGSIAIDGVSLTISEIFDDSFRITIIEHTLKNTMFHLYETRRRVNIETDLFARYTARILECSNSLDRKNNYADLDRFAAMF